MDEIITLYDISKMYYFGGKHFGNCIFTGDEGVANRTFQNEDYDEHYRICYEAATNFINTSNVFSELKPAEIIKAFTGIEFKNNRVLIGSLSYINFMNFRVFPELLRVNKEMLVALIKAIIDEKITKPYYFIDDNGVLGSNRSVLNDEMIRSYRILLEYNHFSLDNLNIKNIINDIKPLTKRAI